MSLFGDDRRTLLKRLSRVSALGLYVSAAPSGFLFGQKPKDLFSDKHQQRCRKDRLVGFTSAGRWHLVNRYTNKT